MSSKNVLDMVGYIKSVSFWDHYKGVFQYTNCASPLKPQVLPPQNPRSAENGQPHCKTQVGLLNRPGPGREVAVLLIGFQRRSRETHLEDLETHTQRTRCPRSGVDLKTWCARNVFRYLRKYLEGHSLILTKHLILSLKTWVLHQNSRFGALQYGRPCEAPTGSFLSDIF